MQFKQGDVFLRRNAIHNFENALLGGCHFSRVPQIGLMSVARFSWVPNLYNIHFLVENHRPQPDPVNSYRDYVYIYIYYPQFLYLHMQRLASQYLHVHTHIYIYQLYNSLYTHIFT